MRNILQSDWFVFGLALFSMFFGAGNLIFPLAVGQYAGEGLVWAMLGLVITAVIMPILGVITMIVFEGKTGALFGRLGRWPGILLALVIISLLGPFGSTPRCIALAYTTLKNTFIEIPSPFFSAAACLLIFFFSFKKNRLLSLLGWILTPLLLLFLFLIMAMGFIHPSPIETKALPESHLFFHGLLEGYNTMDLLAAFFFSSTLVNNLRGQGDENGTNYKRVALKASALGATLLTLTYLGFGLLAATHGKEIVGAKPDEFLSAIAIKIAGNYAGTLVCITVALACLTTAIALVVAFSEFIHKEICQEKIEYRWILIGALILTFFISMGEFEGISAFLGPILQTCCPGLIVFTVLTLFFRGQSVKWVKICVFATFVLTALYYWV